MPERLRRSVTSAPFQAVCATLLGLGIPTWTGCGSSTPFATPSAAMIARTAEKPAAKDVRTTGGPSAQLETAQTASPSAPAIASAPAPKTSEKPVVERTVSAGAPAAPSAPATAFAPPAPAPATTAPKTILAIYPGRPRNNAEPIERDVANSAPASGTLTVLKANEGPRNVVKLTPLNPLSSRFPFIQLIGGRDYRRSREGELFLQVRTKKDSTGANRTSVTWDRFIKGLDPRAYLFTQGFVAFSTGSRSANLRFEKKKDDWTLSIQRPDSDVWVSIPLGAANDAAEMLRNIPDEENPKVRIWIVPVETDQGPFLLAWVREPGQGLTWILALPKNFQKALKNLVPAS